MAFKGSKPTGASLSARLQPHLAAAALRPLAMAERVKVTGRPLLTCCGNSPRTGNATAGCRRLRLQLNQKKPQKAAFTLASCC